MKLKTVLITGASGRLGSAVAKRFHADGWDVIAHCRARAVFSLKNTVSCSGLFSVKADLSCEKDIDDLIRFCKEKAGTLNAFVFCSGTSISKLAMITRPAEWDHVLTVNLTAFFKLVRGLIPIIKKGGHIVAAGSHGAAHGIAGACAYSASKTALEGLMKSLAKEHPLLHFNIVCPHAYASKLVSKKQTVVKKNLSICGAPHKDRLPETAEFIAHLCSSSGVTGQVFAWDDRVL